MNPEVAGEIVVLKMNNGVNHLKYLNHLKSVNILLEEGEIKLHSPLKDDKVTRLIPYILISKNAGIMRTKAARKYIPENIVSSHLNNNKENNKTAKKTVTEEKKAKPAIKVVTILDKTKGKKIFKFRVGKITKLYSCGDCRTVFQRNIELQIHLLKHIQTKRPFVKLYSYKLPMKFKIDNNEEMYLNPIKRSNVNMNMKTIDLTDEDNIKVVDLTNEENTKMEEENKDENNSPINPGLLPNDESALENEINLLENNLEELFNLDSDDTDSTKRKHNKSILVNSPKENDLSQKSKKVRFSSETTLIGNSISNENITEDKDNNCEEEVECPDLNLSDIEEDVEKDEEFFESPTKTITIDEKEIQHTID